MVDREVGLLVGQVVPFIMNLLAIHNNFFGSGNPETHFLAYDVNDQNADMVANHNRFTDFSR